MKVDAVKRTAVLKEASKQLMGLDKQDDVGFALITTNGIVMSSVHSHFGSMDRCVALIRATRDCLNALRDEKKRLREELNSDELAGDQR